MPMPNRNIEGGYRYGYQGEYAEKDQETGKEAFELRLWDGRIGRWLTIDPYGQYDSPYLGMGNDPINGIDSDGGYRTQLGAYLGWIGSFFRGKVDHTRGGGDKEWAISKAVRNENYGNNGDDFLFIIQRDYGSNFFIEGNAGLSVGPQIGVDVDVLGAKGSVSGHYNRIKIDMLGFGYSSKKGLHNRSQQQGSYDNLTSGNSWGIGVIGQNREYYPSSGTHIPNKYNGQIKSKEDSAFILGKVKEDYDTSGNLIETSHSWGIGSDVKIVFFGVHFNFDVGYKDVK